MKTILVFSGAGLSAESGIPTFRASDGLWENHKVEDVASQEGWQRDPSLVLDFYQQRFESVKRAEPNAAHKAIAKLEEKYNVINITQNIDNLLERAGCSNVIHLHGSIMCRKCEWHEDIMPSRSKNAWGLDDGDTEYNCTYKTNQDKPVEYGELCPICNGQLRPDVVWFGEAVDLDEVALRKVLKEIKYNDGVFICVGTSAQVAPASFIIPWASQLPNKYIVNPQATPIADYTLLKESAGKALPQLVDKLLDCI